MLTPVTPDAPNRLKRYPPTMAPTIPKTMSSTNPSPVLFTILLPMNPAMSPKTIQARIDMSTSLGVARGGATVSTETRPMRVRFILGGAEGTLLQSAPELLSTVTAPSLLLQLNLAANQLLFSVSGSPVCDILFYHIKYETVGGANEATTASAALLV